MSAILLGPTLFALAIAMYVLGPLLGARLLGARSRAQRARPIRTGPTPPRDGRTVDDHSDAAAA